MGNRDAAYHFIIQQLEIFKKNTQKSEEPTPETTKYIQKLEKEAQILKNGVRIQNQKLSQNYQKVKHFDELWKRNQTVEHELAQAKMLISHMLKNQI